MSQVTGSDQGGTVDSNEVEGSNRRRGTRRRSPARIQFKFYVSEEETAVLAFLDRLGDERRLSEMMLWLVRRDSSAALEAEVASLRRRLAETEALQVEVQKRKVNDAEGARSEFFFPAVRFAQTRLKLEPSHKVRATLRNWLTGPSFDCHVRQYADARGINLDEVLEEILKEAQGPAES